MSVDYLERGYVSDELVDRMVLDQQDRLIAAPDALPLAVILGSAIVDNESYGLQLLGHAQKLVNPRQGIVTPPIELYVPTADGFEVLSTPEDFRAAREERFYVPTPDKAHEHDDNIVGLVQDLSRRKQKVLPLLPPHTPEGDTKIRAAIDPHHDPDGISHNPLVAPATPEAMVIFAEHIFGMPIDKIDPRKLCIIGMGKLVGIPLRDKVLPSHDVDPAKLGLILETRKDVEAGVPGIKDVRHKIEGKEDDYTYVELIFATARAGGILRKEHIRPGTVIVDAGYGIHPELGIPTGNIDPGLLALNGIYGTFTSFRHGVGPVTAAIVFDRSIPPRQPTFPSPTSRPDRQLVSTGA